MPATRTTRQNREPSSQASSSKSKLHVQKPKRTPHTAREPHAQAAPGVQKIKAALRQTRRLLAKDKLAADVRVGTERRLKALEADLARAERARKERALATRYHKHKFIERQKVTRKLNQTKRELEECTDKKEKKKLQKALLELRVDLNYILHYPKLKKYISLFPPEVRQKGDADDKGKAKEAEKQANEKAATDIQREDIRQQIRAQMEKGELSEEPELEDRASRKSTVDVGEAIEQTVKSSSSGPKRVPEVVDDEFFGEESGEDEDVGMDED